MTKSPTILEVAQSHIEGRDISAQYVATLLRRARCFVEFAGDPTPAAFSYATLNAYLASLDGQMSRSTLKGYRGDIIAIWRAAALHDLCPMPDSRRIVRRRVQMKPPECYQIDDVRKLVRATTKLPGKMRDGTPRRSYWECAVRIAWETGLRRSDIVQVDAKRLRGVMLSTISHKTATLTVHELTDATVASLLKLDNRKPSLGWPHRWKSWDHWWFKIRSGAGIDYGCFKWLRRASGSYIERTHPGMGPRHLGHTCPTTFAKHYDARMIAEPGALPKVPEI